MGYVSDYLEQIAQMIPKQPGPIINEQQNIKDEELQKDVQFDVQKTPIDFTSGLIGATSGGSKLDKLKGYTEQIENLITRKTPLERMNLAPVASLIDQLTGSQLARSYKRPPSLEENLYKLATLYKGNEGAGADSPFNQLLKQTRLLTMLSTAKEKGFGKEGTGLAKLMEAFDVGVSKEESIPYQRHMANRQAEMANKMTLPGPRNILGILRTTEISAERSKATVTKYVDDYKKENGISGPLTENQKIEAYNRVPPFIASDLVVGAARTIFGSAPTEEVLKGLNIDTWMSNLKRLVGKVTNAPKGAKLGKFIVELEGLLDKENVLVNQEASKIINTLSRGYRDVMENNPRDFFSIIGEAGGSVAEKEASKYYMKEILDKQKSGEPLNQSEEYILRTYPIKEELLKPSKPVTQKRTQTKSSASSEKYKQELIDILGK